MRASSELEAWYFRCIMNTLKAKQFGCSTKTQSRRLSYFPRALKVRWTFAQREPKWNGEWSTAEKCRWTFLWRIWIYLNSRGAKGPGDLCLARTEAERRQATYEQLKAYVLEQTGLKVSSLYIAQIKKKCGMDVGENFNLAKSENARQPQCTSEKEDAIMQAFRHFGII